MLSATVLLAAALLTVERGGMSLRVEGPDTPVDPARSVFVTVTLTAPRGVRATPPDFRDRVRGFSLAEDFEEPAKTLADGTVEQTVNWKLVPEPCAEEYKIAPFVVKASPALLSSAAEEDSLSFWAGPVRFAAPSAREAVTGAFETDPRKDLPPFSWRLVGWAACGLLALAGLLFAAWRGVRYLARRVREHRMSPIERAWAELDRLLQKGLPGRGRYKDFYVELTMVVRRYVQRKYGVKAPHLTTEEFLAQVSAGAVGALPKVAELRRFLEASDLVKFAGVEATPEMADAATESARGYLRGSEEGVKG